MLDVYLNEPYIIQTRYDIQFSTTAMKMNRVKIKYNEKLKQWAL